MAVGRETIDDVNSTLGEETSPVPGVIVVATGHAVRRRILCQGFVRCTLGRTAETPTGTVDLDDGRMSREHAHVERVGHTWLIRDLDSRNGTYVGGERISGQVQLTGDVVVRCGHTVFLLLSDVRDLHRDDDHEGWVVGGALSRVFADIRRHASASTLLILGESGSGKELAAREFHARGPRAGGPFIAVNCAAIPEGVAERLLFGARKGAVSGATADAVGYLQSADGGTLFLDEVAELDLGVQAVLLRALETREVVPVGATAGVRVDVGVVAATHRDLRAAVAGGRFRDDLYYRLAHPMVVVPPLRERRADIPRLIVREVREVDPKLSVHARLVETCCLRPWPGNVRELQRAVREAASAARGAGRDAVRPEDLTATAGLPVIDASTPGSALSPAMATPPGGVVPGGVVPGAAALSPATAAPAGAATTGTRGKVSPADVDRATVEAALGAAGGNISAAARSLGLHRTQLYRLLQKYGLIKPGDDGDV